MTQQKVLSWHVMPHHMAWEQCCHINWTMGRRNQFLLHHGHWLLEKQYFQLEKEALAIVFGVKRFHQYLFGRQFLIMSDHKPLQGLFQETTGIPTMASARIQRWALPLSAYNYKIQFLLSRLPLPETPTHIPEPGEIWSC